MLTMAWCALTLPLPLPLPLTLPLTLTLTLTLPPTLPLALPLALPLTLATCRPRPLRSDLRSVPSPQRYAGIPKALAPC